MRSPDAVSSSIVTQATAQLPLPRWIKFRASEGIGRDPLGLDRVPGRVLDDMFPGLTTQTTRARYYSFYCWAIDRARKASPVMTTAMFTENFQPLEAALALATLAAAGEGDVRALVGARTAKNRFGSGKAKSYRVDFRALPSNSLGGLGQYYGGAIRRLGLITRDELGVLKLAPLGERLAAEYGAAVKSTAHASGAPAHQEEVARKVLAEYGAVGGLDAIHASEKEQALLTELFFYELEHDASVGKWQRETLALILHLADFLAGIGDPLPDDKRCDFWLLRQVLYYGEAGNGARYEPPAALERTAAIWRTFQADWFFTIFLEHLGAAVTETLALTPGGMKLPDLLDRLTGGEEFEAAIGTPSASLQKTVNERFAPMDDEGSARFDHETKANAEGSEHSIALALDDGQPVGAARAALAVEGLLAVAVRNLHRMSDGSWTVFRGVAGEDLWAGNFVGRTKQRWQQPDLTLREFVELLIVHLVVDQHELILYDKRRHESRRIARRGDLLESVAPIYRANHSSRWQNAAQILQDLALLSPRSVEDCVELHLSDRGREWFNRVIGVG